MSSTHDIFLRAYVLPVNPKKKRKRPAKQENESKWPSHALIFDTETQISADQSLTFGVYRLCELLDGEYRIWQEGIFYADDLPPRDLNVLKAYQETAIQDVPSF